MFKGLSFLLRYSWKFNKRYVFYIFSLQVVSSLLPLLNIIVPKFIIDELMGEKRVEFIVFYVGVLLCYNLIGGLAVTLLRGKSFTSKNKVFCKFQSMIAHKLSLCDFCNLEDPEFLNIKEQAGKFLYANGQGFGMVLDSAVNIIGKLFVFAGIVAVISTLNIFIVIIFVALVLLNAVVETKVRKNYVKWDMEKAPIERKTAYFLNLVENFAFGKEIRIFNLSQWLVGKIEAHLETADKFYQKQTADYNKASYFSTITGFVRDIVSYIYLCVRVIGGSIGIGDFTMYLSAISQFNSAMNEVMQSIVTIKQFSMYYDALDKYMNVPATMRAGVQKLPAGERYCIEFADVSFKYPKAENYALKSINIKLYPGEKLSVVGENGAGKTTFVKLLCRLYDPTDGKILLNGIDIRNIEYDEYMSILATVFQDYKLLSFSIKDNIAFGEADNIPDADVEELLCEAGLEQKISSLDAGIHTNIYKNFEAEGFEPSGGEGQKICIARAMYKDAHIIVLDEPTSALDPKAEYELYQKFHNMVQGRTAIFVSHRLSISKLCDKIAVFSDGSIVEYGSHDELMEHNGMYAEFFNLQSQYYV